MDTDIGKAIELRVEDISQLFDTLDPFPFRERDLNKDAEEYIVGWARELPADQPIKIIVYLPSAKAHQPPAAELGEAFSHYFDYRADVLKRDLNELFRVGRRSLAIGLTILLVCLVAAQAAVGRGPTDPFARLIEQSLLILGWVANWRPLEIFLYDWWPIVRRRRLYRRLSSASVDVRQDPQPAPR